MAHMPQSAKIVVPDLDGSSGPVTWAKREGDVVDDGDGLAEIDLGFAKTTVTAPCAGRLGKILVADGQEAHARLTLGVVEVDDALVTSKPIDVCSSCGVLRSDRATKCAHCHAPHTNAGLSAPRSPDALWVSAECTFKCRMCGFVVPLNHIDMDGAVLCARCGLDQAFAVQKWHDAFELAHAVADGAEAIAKNQISSKRTIDPENAFEITVSPGHPLCDSCHALLAVGFEEREGSPCATTSCATCKTNATYAIPRAASKMTQGALRGAIISEHRVDRAAAKIEQTPGAIAIQCPSCSAPLDATNESKIAHCKYCGTTSHIPDTVFFRVSGKVAGAESMWLAFRGASRVRRDAEHVRARRQQDEELHRLRTAKRAFELQMRDAAATAQRQAEEAHATATIVLPQTQAQATPAAPAPPPRNEPARTNVTRFVVLALLAAIAIAAGVYAFMQHA